MWLGYLPDTYPDVSTTPRAFMDNLLMWEGKATDLQEKVLQLQQCP